MEKENDWKEVKKKTSKKNNDQKESSNTNDFSSYCNTDVQVVTSKKSQYSFSSKNNLNSPKYQPPSIKNKAAPKNVSSNRGGRGARSGKWGRRGDIASIPDFENEDEKLKFMNLQKVCPHIVMPGTARREALLIRIDNYVEKILSEEWITFQCDGWKFVRIIKPDDTDFEIPDEGYELLNLENKYNDFALFQRV